MNNSLKENDNDIENTLIEISKYIEVGNYDSIPNKLIEMINYLKSLNNNNEQIQNKEFINNVRQIYIKENNIII